MVAKELQKYGYKVTGLDINPHMLEKAKQIIDEKYLIEGDMTSFDLQKQYDALLCNYNSICHLLTWEDWRSFFQHTAKHLKQDGLFIFDINTLFEFENITREFAQFYNF